MFLDEIPDRRNTGSLKWDHFPEEIIPLWVADMDFPVSDSIQQALLKRIEHSIFGYAVPPVELESVIIERMERRYDVFVDKEWIVWLPGSVSGFNVAVRAFCAPGEEVLTNVPAYPPFLQCGENNGCRTVSVPLAQNDGQWSFDLEALGAGVTSSASMFLLCSPHNPTGRLWKESELTKVGAFCLQNKLVICSDEIHCDLILEKDRRHIPLFSLSDEIAQRTVTLMAPSKAFNIAGLNCSFAIIANRELRSNYRAAMAGLVPYVNTFGYTAALAAYRDSQEWLDDVLEYLRGNYAFLSERIGAMSGLAMSPVEATYLAWIDVRGTGLKNPYEYFLNHGVALSDGRLFGMPGFVRLNFACSRSILNVGLERMEKALSCL